MKAITLHGFGGVENLKVETVEKPSIEPAQVLIETRAISINPVDVKTRKGKGVSDLIKDELPAILGWDVAGTIKRIGDQVRNLKVGDDVFGMIAFPLPGKTYAEYVAASASELALKPVNISYGEGAAASLAALTAWQAMTLHGHIKQGDRVLVHAGSGGVGHYAIQIAKHFGAYVITTASGENRPFVLSIGADEHIDYKSTPFETATKDIDFVLDTIGGEYIDRSLAVTKRGGTIISIPSGLNEAVKEKAEKLGINGAKMRVHPGGNDMDAIARLLQSGVIKSHIDKRFPFEKMADAHVQIESGHTVGKVVLTV